MVHGTQHRAATPTASAPRFHRQRRSPRARSTTQPNKNGSKAPSAGFVSNTKPHNNPYTPQSSHCSDSVSSKVAHKINAAKSADNDVSQIHSNGIITALGKTAQSHAAPAATPNPPSRFPAKKIGTQAAEEKSMLSATHAKNARAVKVPNSLNVAATSKGYTGASQAVGPVSVRNTLPNPLPCAKAYAMFPVSC